MFISGLHSTAQHDVHVTFDRSAAQILFTMQSHAAQRQECVSWTAFELLLPCPAHTAHLTNQPWNCNCDLCYTRFTLLPPCPAQYAASGMHVCYTLQETVHCQQIQLSL
jgi:hypothetical protein